MYFEDKRWPVKETCYFEDYDIYILVYPFITDDTDFFMYMLGESFIAEAVKRLLLDKYDLSYMPDSDIFIAQFRKLAAGNEKPFSEKKGSVIYWYEFLLKLADENESLIDSERSQSLPDALLSFVKPEIQQMARRQIKQIHVLRDSVFEASMKALKYLLDKSKRAEIEQNNKAKGNKGKKKRGRDKEGHGILDKEVEDYLKSWNYKPGITTKEIADAINKQDANVYSDTSEPSVRQTNAWKNYRKKYYKSTKSKRKKHKKK